MRADNFVSRVQKMFRTFFLFSVLALPGCQKEREPIDTRIKQMDPARTALILNSVKNAKLINHHYK